MITSIEDSPQTATKRPGVTPAATSCAATPEARASSSP